MSTADQTVGIVWLVLFLPIAIVFTVWFYLRRNIQPIKARQFELVIAINVVLIMFGFILGLQRIYSDQFPCLWNVWMGHLGVIFMLNAYFWRVWNLFFRFHQAKARVEVANDNVAEGKFKFAFLRVNPQFFLRSSYLISFPFFMRSIGSLAVAMLMPVSMFVGQNWAQVHRQKGDLCDKGWSTLVQVTYACIYLIFYMLMCGFLRGVTDRFKIRDEFKYLGFSCLVLTPVWGITNVVDGLNDTFPVSSLFLFIIVAIAFFSSTVWPVYLSKQYVEVPADAHAMGFLQGILSTEKGRKSFETFLMQEFSVENILFYFSVEEFERNYPNHTENSPSYAHAIVSIYEKYISETSEYQINLPANILGTLHSGIETYKQRAKEWKKQVSSTRQSTKASTKASTKVLKAPANDQNGQVEDADENLHFYSQARVNIFKLMESDSFKRYKLTDDYKALLEEAKREQKENDALKGLNMA